MKKYFITGIGTNVGKTVVSAVLTEKLKADYWKPIQAGTEPQTDTQFVKSLVTNLTSSFHQEAYCLRYPGSPHFAAKEENIQIDISSIKIPQTNNTLIIEGAGGVLVPINKTHFVIDLAKQFDAEILLVVSNYLGSINHTLLTIDFLSRNNFKVKGLIFTGDEYDGNEEIIRHFSPFPFLGRIPRISILTKESILNVANNFFFN